MDLVCSETYNQAYFLLEIATNDYGPLNHHLIDKIGTGKNGNYRRLPEVAATSSLVNLTTDVHHHYWSPFIHQFVQVLFWSFFDFKPRHRERK